MILLDSKPYLNYDLLQKKNIFFSIMMNEEARNVTVNKHKMYLDKMFIQLKKRNFRHQFRIRICSVFMAKIIILANL
jgi:hypothetical protein